MLLFVSMGRMGRGKKIAPLRISSSFLSKTKPEIGSQSASVWLLYSDCVSALTIMSREMATSLLVLSFILFPESKAQGEKRSFV